MIGPRRILGLLALGLATLVACGSGGDGTADPPVTTTAAPQTTSSVTLPPVDCDEAAMLAIVDEELARARLAPGEWHLDGTTRFDADTKDAGEFNVHHHFDCALRAAQVTADGDERLVLMGWTLPRWAFVVQATDAPSVPYSPDVTFYLLRESRLGEWIVDEFVWATTLDDGSSLVIGAHDYSTGATAKSWQGDFDPLPPADVNLESERYGIAALEGVGARGVGVAQFPEVGSEVGTLMAVSARGQVIEATIAPEGWMDWEFAWLSGPTEIVDVDGTPVRATQPGEGELTVGEVAWAACGWSWRLTSTWGDTDELVELAGLLIAHAEHEHCNAV